MPVTPEELLQLADTLSAQPEESAFRASVSRSYYAAYHACNRKYRSTRADSGMHRNFIDSLSTSPESQERRIGFMLDDIYRSRIRADYRVELPFTAEEATQQHAAARRLLAVLA